MHVFVAGGTGVIGRRVVPRLVRAGHRVTALTRDVERAALLQAAGAEAVVGDATDAYRLSRIMLRARPDAIMNQLTDLAAGSSAANARLRIRGMRSLMAAARAADVPRVVAQSIAWAYAAGGTPAVEGDPLDGYAGEPRRTTVDAVRILERTAQRAPDWVVLRYGMLYGPDTWYWADGVRADEARAGLLAATGDVTSFLHVDDAAAAAVEALHWPSGAVNVVDDEPAAARQWLPVFCGAVGAPPPEDYGTRRDPTARGADNTHARSVLGWTPIWRTWRDGMAAMSSESEEPGARVRSR